MPASASVMYTQDDAAERRDNPVGYARSILLRFQLWKLLGAEVYKSDVPDLSNPGGYYHRWVVLKYKTWLGISRRKILYYEETAFDEMKQDAVYDYVESLLKAINVLHA